MCREYVSSLCVRICSARHKYIFKLYPFKLTWSVQGEMQHLNIIEIIEIVYRVIAVLSSSWDLFLRFLGLN